VNQASDPQPGDSAAVVRDLVPSHDGPGTERQVSTDHANLSIAVDERYLVKWLREPVPDDRLAPLEHLRAVGFVHTPRFVGARCVDGHVAVIVHELVPGATDGWVWYVDDVVAWLEGRTPLDGLVATAATLGRIAAELHGALRAVGPVEVRGVDGERRRVASLLDRALARASSISAGVLPSGGDRSPVDHDDADRFLARRPVLEHALGELDRVDLVEEQRLHGDLHAGQFLRAGDRLLVTDLDGDPTAAAAGGARGPVERDLAALVQSVDHVGRVAARRRSGADVTPFVVAATRACADGYASVRPYDAQLLAPLRIAQELHEHLYAWERLPVWRYVPDAALGFLLG
jgi:maltokinase